ncbi:MAG TPA: cation transporter [Candidatus Dormibacteraeota bacterium]|nr:cation transporter [Candidatus Dormibacteraeota bacterium]
MDLTRATAVRRGLRLEVVTVGWMLVEACVALGAGVAARSALLTAFGLDSVVELLSGIVLYRRLQVESGGAPAEDVDRLEARTTAISAVLLIVLCVFVVLSSIVGIVLRIEPEGSLVGIAVSALAVVAMPLLAWQKRRVNAVVGSPSLRADIAETISCAYLAGVTLAGLAATTLFGWWWAQYVAAIALLIWLVPEAREAFWAWRDNEPD